MTNHTNLRPGQLVPVRLDRHESAVEVGRSATPDRRQSGSVAVLERRADRVTRRAAQGDVRIDYLGVHPLFIEPRLYSGVDTDWVVAPVQADDERYVPRPQRAVLNKLREAGLEFPRLYVAHEVAKQPGASSEPTVMSRSAALELVGPTPDPQQAVDLSHRLGHASDAVIRTAARAIPIIGAIAAAPFIVVGGAIAALATMDPVVFGVMPQGRVLEGEPAAWFVLTRWDW
jgi:hypothetical protein